MTEDSSNRSATPIDRPSILGIWRLGETVYESSTAEVSLAQPADEPVAEPAAESADRPKHVRLSYKPEKPMSILELPGDFWAVQLVALSSPEAVEEYVERHQMRGMSAARIWDGSQLFYVLLLGIYETRAVAEEAVTDLPPPFNLHTPWIRPLASLQRAMVAADEIAGDSNPAS